MGMGVKLFEKVLLTMLVLALVAVCSPARVRAASVAHLRSEIAKLKTYQPYESALDEGYDFVKPCPPVTFNDCAVKCPPGWSPDQEKISWGDTHMVVCKPPAGEVMYPQRCYYINYKCYTEEPGGEDVLPAEVTGGIDFQPESVVPGTPSPVAYTGEESITLPELLVGIMTADADVYDILLKHSGSSSKGDRVGKAFWNFAYGSYVTLLDIIRTLSFLFVTFMIAWFIGSYSYNAWVFMKFEREGAFPYLSFPTYMTRFALAAFLFFFPLPDSKINNQPVFQPLFVKLVRGAAAFGNRKASEAVKKLNDEFIAFALETFSETKLSDKGEYTVRIKEYNELLDKIKSKEKEIVQNCYLVYDAHTFQLPDEVLKKIRFTPKGEIEGTYWSRERCREEEANYLAMVASYNNGVQQLKTKFAKALGKVLSGRSGFGAVKYLERDFKTLEGALGWMSFPVVVVPAVRAVTVMDDAVVESISESVNVMGTKFTDVSSLKSAAGKKVTRWMVIVSLPPGSWILKGITGLSEKLANSIAGSFMSKNIVTRIVSAVGVGGLGFTMAVAIAYVVLKLIAVIAILVGVAFRFVAYLIEVLKIAFVSPFIAVWGVTLKRHENIMGFGGRILYVMAYPIMMVISAFAAVLAVVIVEFVVYTIPVAGLQFLQNSRFHIGAEFIVSDVILYMIAAFFWYVSIIGSSLAGFVIAYNGPEWIVEAFGRWEGHWQGVVGFSRQVSERVSMRVISPV